MKAKGDVGLRFVVAKRSGLSTRLGKSGLLRPVTSSDVPLGVGRRGAYPDIQMGISQTGFAYIDKNGNLRNLDNPMDGEYVGPGNLTSEHYRTLNSMHIIRPRNLTDAQKAKLLAWATKLNASAGKVYRAISFNEDVKQRSISLGCPLDFVKTSAPSLRPGRFRRQADSDMYCSVYVFSLLSLRNGDPRRRGRLQGHRGRVVREGAGGPAMKATGNVLPTHGGTAIPASPTGRCSPSTMSCPTTCANR